MIQIELDSIKISSSFDSMYKYIHENLIRLWKDCIKEFIYIVSENIAVDTGMSMASLYPLATKVRLGTLIESLSHGFGPKIGHKNLTGKFASNNARYKSRELGKRLGNQAYKLSFGVPKNPELVFEFEIVVFQYFLHENGLGLNSNNIWNTLEKGKLAFVKYWEDNADKYIKVKDIYNYLNGDLNG